MVRKKVTWHRKQLPKNERWNSWIEQKSVCIHPYLNKIWWEMVAVVSLISSEIDTQEESLKMKQKTAPWRAVRTWRQRSEIWCCFLSAVDWLSDYVIRYSIRLMISSRANKLFWHQLLCHSIKGRENLMAIYQMM